MSHKNGVTLRGGAVFFLVILGFLSINLSPAFCSNRGPIKVLVSGFEPFGSHRQNPSEEIVRFINSNKIDRGLDDVIIKGVILPVTYFECWRILKKVIENFKPDFIISLGYSPGSRRIRLESLAQNYDRGYRDNNWKEHLGTIIPDGSRTYSSELPLNIIKEALAVKGFATYISNDAGGYLCNHIFYNVMHYSKAKPAIKAGFIHIPSWPVQGESGLWAALKVIVDVLKTKSVKVGVFEFEPLKNDVDRNIGRIEQLIEHTKCEGIDFYIFPEMALTGIVYASPEELLNNNVAYKEDNAIDRLKGIAKGNGIYLAIGLVDKADGKLYNSYQILSPSGELALLYRKNHLYGTDLNWAMSGDSNYPILETSFGKIGCLICHDVVYDDSFLEYTKKNVNFLIIGTNWIGTSPIHKYLMEYSKKGITMFISDRRGQEQGIAFHGNTSIVHQMEIIYPSAIRHQYTGIIYLFVGG